MSEHILNDRTQPCRRPAVRIAARGAGDIPRLRDAARRTGWPMSARLRPCRRSRIPRRSPGYKPVQMPMPQPRAGELRAEFAMAAGLARLLQGPARPPDRRSRHRPREDHRQGRTSTTPPSAGRQNDRELRRGQECSASRPRSARSCPRTPKADTLLAAKSDSGSSRPGSVKRSEELVTNVAAVVTQALPNGNLVDRGQAGDPRQLRDPRADRGRRHPARGHRGRQHDRQRQDRPGAHRLWRPRPDHRRAAAALRPQVMDIVLPF